MLVDTNNWSKDVYWYAGYNPSRDVPDVTQYASEKLYNKTVAIWFASVITAILSVCVFAEVNAPWWVLLVLFGVVVPPLLIINRAFTRHSKRLKAIKERGDMITIRHAHSECLLPTATPWKDSSLVTPWTIFNQVALDLWLRRHPVEPDELIVDPESRARKVERLRIREQEKLLKMLSSYSSEIGVFLRDDDVRSGASIIAGSEASQSTKEDLWLHLASQAEAIALQIFAQEDERANRLAHYKASDAELILKRGDTLDISYVA